MKLSYEEEIELRYLSLNGFNYLVRNEKGTVEVFVYKPHKEKNLGYGTWVETKYPMTLMEQQNRRHIGFGKYQFITWDSEPLLITDLLN